MANSINNYNCPGCGYIVEEANTRDKSYYRDGDSPLTGVATDCIHCKQRFFISKLEMPTIKDMLSYLEEGKKIQAIKLLKDEASMGLKNAKDCIDFIAARYDKTYNQEKDRLERAKEDNVSYVDCTPLCNQVYGQHSEICKRARNVM